MTNTNTSANIGTHMDNFILKPRGWLLAALLALAGAAPVHADPSPNEVRFLVSEIWAMPFGEFDKPAGSQPVLKRGAMLDWQLALAQALGRKARFVAAPYLRHPMVVANKGADVQCMTSPEWVQRDAYEWPEPFYTVDEQVVGSASKPLVRTVADLQSKKMGTVLGYHYPMLDPLFAKAQLQRVDAPSEEIAYRKLLSGRTDYAIMRSADFAYRKAQDPQSGVLVLSPLVVNHTPVHCALIKGSGITLDELRAAQRKVMKKTPFTALLDKYQQP